MGSEVCVKVLVRCGRCKSGPARSRETETLTREGENPLGPLGSPMGRRLIGEGL